MINLRNYNLPCASVTVLNKYLFYLFVIYLSSCTISVSGWSFGGILDNMKTYARNPSCMYSECCDESNIHFERYKLENDLKTNVFGQPLVYDVVAALSSHLLPNSISDKALAISFHGMTGTGKNYVSEFIAKSMFTKGIHSDFVHYFSGRIQFPEESRVNEYRNQLGTWLPGNISRCPHQLFIFDEVDKMVPFVLDHLKPMLDHRSRVMRVDFSKAVFIFLSNTGAHIIREHFYDLVKMGRRRDDLSLYDFETLIQQGAFNEPGGFLHSDTISNRVIDHYIPFLPLEEKHVIKCIRREFNRRGINFPSTDQIEQVLKSIEWGPSNLKLFSKTGCRGLGSKVAMLVQKQNSRWIKYEDEF